MTPSKVASLCMIFEQDILQPGNTELSLTARISLSKAGQVIRADGALAVNEASRHVNYQIRRGKMTEATREAWGLLIAGNAGAYVHLDPPPTPAEKEHWFDWLCKRSVGI